QFECNCSKDRFGSAIISLGESEIRDMIEEDGGAEAQCHFCMEKYNYSVNELESFIDEINS
ncbi:MAG: Hsp33 family molecular chaperone HslO, partial [Psychrobacillus sp.]